MRPITNFPCGNGATSHKKTSSFIFGSSCILCSPNLQQPPKYYSSNPFRMSSVRTPPSPDQVLEPSSSQQNMPSEPSTSKSKPKKNKSSSEAPFTSKFSIHESPDIPNSFSSAFSTFSLNSGQSFASANSTPEKPYACNQCDQSFSRLHNLKSHYLTHNQERQHQCTICHHYFRRQHDLKRHVKLHTGERPHECELCGRTFARLDSLNRHRKADGGTGCSTSKNRGKVAIISQEPSTSASSNQVLHDPKQTLIQISTLTQQASTSNSTEYIFYHHSPTESHSSPIIPSSLNQTSSSQLLGSSTIPDSPQSSHIWQMSSTQEQAHSEPPSDTIAHLVHPNRSGLIERLEYERESSYELHRGSSVSTHSDDGSHDRSYLYSREYLKERNRYLETRVSELEHEVIAERKLRKHREYLEERVRELEIEKSLLKSLLIERRDESNKPAFEKKRKST
ncbi:hypothetical protein K7432_003548 [Basidiobolus ranarum]|uniref:C2H2-type domain-containing protein n=1 Tax=Basidiobolus ranarum TaxID=34480 RepID=A0ABR2W6G2_9FUNG